jgi:hypothetical protein
MRYNKGRHPLAGSASNLTLRRLITDPTLSECKSIDQVLSIVFELDPWRGRLHEKPLTSEPARERDVLIRQLGLEV